MKFLKKLGNNYAKLLITHPYKTEMVTIGVLYGSADYIV